MGVPPFLVRADPFWYLAWRYGAAIGSLFKPISKGDAGVVDCSGKPCSIFGTVYLNEHVAQFPDCFMCWMNRVAADVGEGVALDVNKTSLDGHIGPFGV